MDFSASSLEVSQLSGGKCVKGGAFLYSEMTLFGEKTTYLVMKKVIVNFKAYSDWSIFDKLSPHEWLIARPVEPAHIVIITSKVAFA